MVVLRVSIATARRAYLRGKNVPAICGYFFPIFFSTNSSLIRDAHRIQGLRWMKLQNGSAHTSSRASGKTIDHIVSHAE